MACVCDECDDEMYLDEAEEVDGRILCPDCFEAWEDGDDDEEDDAPRQPAIVCPKCRTLTPANRMIEKNEHPRGICPKCAHAYELELFTPPDHSAAECQLCTTH